MPHSSLNISVSVPKPCSQSWNEMTEIENGRFCTACQHTVIDFSALTDSELREYFINVKTIPCGRFHNTQLNRNIPASKKAGSSFLSRYYKAAVTFLGIIALRNDPVAGAKPTHTVTISPTANKSSIFALQLKNTITGTVKNSAGELLEDVQILLDEKLTATTDKNGYFSFDVPETIQKSITLQFRHKGFITIVRNYHPAMLSTSYDISLKRPDEYPSFHTMGVPVMGEDIFPTIPITYNKQNPVLSEDTKSMLSTYASRMRNNPGIVVYVRASNRASELATGKKMQNLVIKYLADHEGISADRLLPVTIKDLKPYTIELSGKEAE